MLGFLESKEQCPIFIATFFVCALIIYTYEIVDLTKLHEVILVFLRL